MVVVKCLRAEDAVPLRRRGWLVVAATAFAAGVNTLEREGSAAFVLPLYWLSAKPVSRYMWGRLGRPRAAAQRFAGVGRGDGPRSHGGAELLQLFGREQRLRRAMKHVLTGGLCATRAPESDAYTPQSAGRTARGAAEAVVSRRGAWACEASGARLQRARGALRGALFGFAERCSNKFLHTRAVHTKQRAAALSKYVFCASGHKAAA